MPIDFADRPRAPTDLQALLNSPATTTVVTEASNCNVSPPTACELLDEPSGPELARAELKFSARTRQQPVKMFLRAVG
jgi:hypothetical protein